MTYLCADQATETVSHKYDRTCGCFLFPIPEADETCGQVISMVLNGVVRGRFGPEMVDVGVVTESQDPSARNPLGQEVFGP